MTDRPYPSPLTVRLTLDDLRRFAVARTFPTPATHWGPRGFKGKRRGAIQEAILDGLPSRAASLEEVNLARADRLIAERLG